MDKTLATIIGILVVLLAFGGIGYLIYRQQQGKEQQYYQCDKTKMTCEKVKDKTEFTDKSKCDTSCKPSGPTYIGCTKSEGAWVDVPDSGAIAVFQHGKDTFKNIDEIFALRNNNPLYKNKKYVGICRRSFDEDGNGFSAWVFFFDKLSDNTVFNQDKKYCDFFVAQKKSNLPVGCTNDDAKSKDAGCTVDRAWSIFKFE